MSVLVNGAEGWICPKCGRALSPTITACPYCGEEMIRGYLMSSRDITFAVDNVTKVFRIKQSDDLELSKGSGGIPHCEAYRCSSCKKILIDYANS